MTTRNAVNQKIVLTSRSMNNSLFKISCYPLLFFCLFHASAFPCEQKTIKRFYLKFAETEHPPQRMISYKKIQRPKIGLALSGGGMRGVAQIGVLKALTEENIPIDYIVGSSIGAVIGGIFASGYSADEIWNFVKKIDWTEILIDTPERSTLFLGEKQKHSRSILNFRLKRLKPSLPQALTPGHKLLNVLNDIVTNAPIHSNDFSKFDTPLRIITTDILNGKKIVVEKGDLVEMMRASIAIPLLLPPIEYGNMLLADGGILDNIPVKEVYDFGANVVIAVNTTSPLRTKSQMTAPWEYADQVTTIMQQQSNKIQLTSADVVIDFSDITGTSTNINEMDKIFLLGYERTKASIEKIKSLSCHKSDNNTYYFKNVQVPNEFENIVHLPTNGYIAEKEIYEILQDIYFQGSVSNCFAFIKTCGPDTFLVFEVTKNPILKDVRFIGNKIIPDSVLIKPFQTMLNKPINHTLAHKALSDLIKLYRNNGYSLAFISNIMYSSQNNCADIFINEGKITSLAYAGLYQTKKYVIDREFSLKLDQIFQYEKAKRGIENLFGTGLFQSINMETNQSGENSGIILRMQEKPSSVVRIGAKFDRDRNGNSFLEISNENLFGTGNDVTIHGQYGDRELGVRLEYRADRIFKTYLTSHLRLHHFYSKHFAYENFNNVGEYGRKSSGAFFSIGQQIERFGTLSGFLRVEKIEISNIYGYGFDTGALFINTFGLNSLVDTRDQMPFPRTGRYHEFTYQVSSGDFLGADISFFKVNNMFETYYTIKHRHTLCTKLFWGTSDLTTPYSEQFRIQERASFYGLREGQLEGRHLVHGSFEYRPLLLSRQLLEFYITLRFDIAASWENTVEIYKEDFITGRGVGLSLKTPFGPVALAYGVTNRNTSRLYFYAGYDF